MNNHFKTFSLIILAFLLFSLPGMATEEIIKLSLDQAIEQALSGNLDLYLTNLEYQQAEEELKRAQIINDSEMLANAQELVEKQAETYANNRRDLITQVRTSYYELLQQEATVANQAKSLDRANDQFKVDQAKFDAGVISTLDLQRSENSVLNAKHTYGNALVGLETKYLEFQRTLGLSLAVKVELTDEINVDYVPFEMELDNAYQLALAYDPSIINAQAAVNTAKDGVAAADNPFTPRVDLEKAEVELEKAEIKLAQAKDALYLRIWNEYYQIKTAAADIATKERELKLEQQVLQAEETKYNAGVISNQAVVSQQEKLAQAETAHIQALWNYSQLRHQFLINIGLTPDLSGGAGDET